ncbi:PPOX class F420-dependent oxidoreductase [bacterium]|nr:PPOX class F420-dependent oxidoreductase [bacterium]
MTSVDIPPQYLDLFSKRAFAHIATIMPDGSPHVSPIWVGYDGKFILVDSVKGRQKDRNMRREAHVAIEVQDPDDPYRYLLIRGIVLEITEEGANDYIDELSMRYRGTPYGAKDPAHPRVLYKIEPLKIATSRH